MTAGGTAAGPGRHARAWRYFRSTPRWWGLALLVLVLLVAFWRLGLWQFHNATADGREQALREAQDRPAVALEEVLPVGSSFPAPERGRTVTTSGRFTGEQFLVPDRRLGGADGSWVVSRFETSAGASLAVLRGFVPGEPPAHAPALPQDLRGQVELTGALEAGEAPSDAVGGSQERHDSVDLAWLVNTWPTPLHNGYLFGDHAGAGGRELPLTSPGMRAVPPPPPEVSGIDWQNAGYAVQWWLFAVFGLWVAVRMLYDEARQAQVASSPETQDPGE